LNQPASAADDGGRSENTSNHTQRERRRRERAMTFLLRKLFGSL